MFIPFLELMKVMTNKGNISSLYWQVTNKSLAATHETGAFLSQGVWSFC